MSNKKALIVVDMQNDYLWNRRKKMFSYNTPELVNAVNSLISEFSERGDDVIYVGQVFPNIITNKWFIGFSIKGTSGAEIYPDVDIVSDNYFEKICLIVYFAKLQKLCDYKRIFGNHSMRT